MFSATAQLLLIASARGSLFGELRTDIARTKGLVLTLTTVATLIGIQINAGAEAQIVADVSAREPGS